MRVRVAAEGRLDLAVAQRLLAERGLVAEPLPRSGGRDALLRKLPGYNAAAEWELWLVLADLDREDCAPGALGKWLPSPSQGMTFRIAVRAVESWLLADRAIAKFLRVPLRTLPRDVDALLDPKRRLIQLVEEQSSSQEVRSAIVRPGRSAHPGQRYNARLSDFVAGEWSPGRAAEQSQSLRRAIIAIRRIGQ